MLLAQQQAILVLSEVVCNFDFGVIKHAFLYLGRILSYFLMAFQVIIIFLFLIFFLNHCKYSLRP